MVSVVMPVFLFEKSNKKHTKRHGKKVVGNK